MVSLVDSTAPANCYPPVCTPDGFNYVGTTNDAGEFTFAGDPSFCSQSKRIYFCVKSATFAVGCDMKEDILLSFGASAPICPAGQEYLDGQCLYACGPNTIRVGNDCIPSCQSSDDCEMTEYCTNTSVGVTCQPVPQGECGEAQNHKWVPYDWQCGPADLNCKQCNATYECKDHVCQSAKSPGIEVTPPKPLEPVPVETAPKPAAEEEARPPAAAQEPLPMIYIGGAIALIAAGFIYWRFFRR